VHVRVPVPLHAPAWHVSVGVQGFPSLHAAPSAFGRFTQPVIGLHVASWHWSDGVHVMTVEPLQAPATHIPAVWHMSGALQLMVSRL
jgi:hypothetical protein